MKLSIISPYYNNSWEQLGSAYLSSYCKNNYNGKLDINFYHGNFDSDEIIINNASKSDIVAFSCTACTFQRGTELAKRIKFINKNSWIIMGGWWTTTSEINPNPEIIDSIGIGEGESIILEVLNGNNSSKIYGNMLEWRDIPWPDRDLINQTRNLDFCQKNYNSRIISFVSKRACGHSCSICGEVKMSKNKLRFRESKDVLDEILYTMKKYNGSFFKMADPSWLESNKEISIEFLEEKIRRDINYPWQCMAHSAFLDKDILKLLKKSNCKEIAIGVESGSQKILNDYKKGTTPNKIREIFKLGKELDISLRGFYILGSPLETIDTIEETKQLIRDTDPEIFGITLLCPYPATKYYREEFKNWNWDRSGEYDNPYWSTKNFTNQELKNIIKDFNNEFKDKLVSHQRCNT